MTMRPSRSLVVSGWLGVVLALVSPPFLGSGVPDDVWNYPLPGGMHVLVSVLLVVDHLLTGHGFLGYARLDGLTSRTRTALMVAAVGLALLAGCEAVSGAFVGADVDARRVFWLGSAFGIVSLVIAVPTLLAGVTALRSRPMTRSAAQSLLASGLLLLVGVTAANITGDPIARAIALALWSLSFVWAGNGLASSLERSHAQAVRI